MLQGLSHLSDPSFDPLQLAAKLQDLEPIQFIDFFLNWLSDLLKSQLAISSSFINIDFQSTFLSFKKNISTKKIMELNTHLLRLRKQISIGINFNKPLLMEETLIRWMGCVS